MVDRIQKAPVSELEPQTDASVLPAIQYLDSATGYREHLSCAGQPTSLQESELVLLDDTRQHRWAKLWAIAGIATLACIIVLLFLQS